MAITHSLRILSGFIPRDTAHFSLHTHILVCPLKRWKTPSIYNTDCSFTHIKHSKLLTPDTQIRGLKTNLLTPDTQIRGLKANLSQFAYSDNQIWGKNSKRIFKVSFSFLVLQDSNKKSKWKSYCNIVFFCKIIKNI